MEKSFDKQFVDLWIDQVIKPNRLEGTWDVDARLGEMARGGLAAEVIFPEFGIPFELFSKFVAALNNYRLTDEQRLASYFAYNRWLVDFVSAAPERFAGMALIAFDDVPKALEEIRWAKASGLRGILLPTFNSAYPVFHPDYEPIWSLCEELEMPVNSHVTISQTFEFGLLPTGIDEYFPQPTPIPHPSVMPAIIQKAVFYSSQQLLLHFIFSGILERHPKLQFVLTESGSAWTVGALKNMDYTYEGAYTHTSIKDFLKLKPSEYYARQCHLGSSVFSQQEVERVEEIGVDQVTLGMDFPHPEGTWGMGPGHLAYLQATIGVSQTPEHTVRQICGGNAVNLWGLDVDQLRPVVESTGPTIEQLLTVPDKDYFPKGDVHKPFGDAR
jgi:predicted TIM-barrel fold metal-dependent hydrolase